MTHTHTYTQQRAKKKSAPKTQQPQMQGITKVTRQKQWTEQQDQALLLALVRCVCMCTLCWY